MVEVRLRRSVEAGVRWLGQAQVWRRESKVSCAQVLAVFIRKLDLRRAGKGHVSDYNGSETRKKGRVSDYNGFETRKKGRVSDYIGSETRWKGVRL